jgi:hypothetical protein
MRAPLWGNSIYHADNDFLSFAWLYRGALIVHGFYHATQAIEKYFKSLALSIIDPNGDTETVRNNRWLLSHDLVALASRSVAHYPYYGQPDVLSRLRRFAEFDQCARYPWVEQKHGNGFTGADLPLIWDMVLHLRSEIPIKIDDYPLGLFIRGHHHGHPEYQANLSMLNLIGGPLEATRLMFPELNKIVRW